MIKKVDHIAIAVSDLNKEIEVYKNIPGFEFNGKEVVEEQKVTVAFFKVGDIFIELLEPLSDDSPISKFIEKRGGGLHHISYEVDDIRDEAIIALKDFCVEENIEHEDFVQPFSTHRPLGTWGVEY